jgi:SpoVK/Ycf46/Vps4 family AAA+-type ATPase
MVGLSSVADEVDTLVSLAEDNKRREALGLPVSNVTNHIILSGNPGTGKTTVAHSIADLYNAVGILPTNKVTVVDRADLGGQYANSVEQSVKNIFKEAKGGVVFVDEAYMLANDEYGKRAANQLMKEMEENRNDTVVILAGYPDEIKGLLSVNPGFARRFPKTIDFPDYTVPEHNKILNSMMTKHGDIFEPSASKKSAASMKHVAALKGNAGSVRNYHDALISARSRRLRGTNPDRKTSVTFVASDVDSAVKSIGIVPAKKGKLVPQ